MSKNLVTKFTFKRLSPGFESTALREQGNAMTQTSDFSVSIATKKRHRKLAANFGLPDAFASVRHHT